MTTIKLDHDPRTGERLDTFSNAATGFGTDADKTIYGEFVMSVGLDVNVLDALFHCHDIPARIVEFTPKECLRKGWCVELGDKTPEAQKVKVAAEGAAEKTAGVLQRKDALENDEYANDDPAEMSPSDDTGDSDLKEEIEEACEELNLNDIFVQADTWGRLYGGAAIVLGTRDGAPSEKPLNLDNIRKLEWLRAVDKRYLSAFSFYETGPKAGEPEVYVYSEPRQAASVFLIHETRLVLFGGALTSYTKRRERGYWDFSVLDRPYEVIRAFETAYKGVEILITDGPQAVWSIDNLGAYVGAGNRAKLEDRLRLVGIFRSVARAIVIDAKSEKFERQNVNFAGIHEVLDRFGQRLSAAAQMPVTVLLGQSPAGMNATGESDFRWMYDQIETRQRNYVAPRLRRILTVLLRAKEGPSKGVMPQKLKIKFESLWTPTATEKADIGLKKAQTASALIQAEVITPDEAALSDEFHDVEIDRDMRTERAKAEADPQFQQDLRDQKLAPPVPPAPPGFTPPEGEKEPPEGG